MSIFAIRNTGAPVYRCQFLGFCDSMGNEVDLGKAVALKLNLSTVRAKVRMVDDHQGRGGKAGEITYTSAVRSIDIELGTIVTQNSIYVFGDIRIAKPNRRV